jgi:hypothetical protein
MKPLLLLLLPIFSSAQSGIFKYSTDGKIHYSAIIELDSSYSKSVIYSNVVAWFSDLTNRYNSEIQNKEMWGLRDNITINNRDSGEFRATGRVLAKQSLNTNVISFDVTVYVKQGKYRYDLTNLYFLGSSLANYLEGSSVPFSETLESMDKKPGKFLLSIDKAMKQVEADMYKQIKNKPLNDF